MNLVDKLEKEEYESKINDLLKITEGLRRDFEDIQLLMIAYQQEMDPGIRKIMNEFSDWQGDNFDKWNGKAVELKKIKILTQNLKSILLKKTGIKPEDIQNLHDKKASQQD